MFNRVTYRPDTVGMPRDKARSRPAVGVHHEERATPPGFHLSEVLHVCLAPKSLHFQQDLSIITKYFVHIYVDTPI